MFQFIGKTIFFIMTAFILFWGISSGVIFYKEYISPPTASMSQDKIDKLIAEQDAINKKHAIKK